ncbi:peroxisomal biogenesis factor 11 [Durotheca rogersii]|uniref:peroxisomal biogenesis factor 11 n=1 Tax=Durotheca rogersii TaxID=419775 RepID=UPI002220307E|nr:peroxisomal biogenesis factor 11 [Durotheca rogersii]KAI5865968.1 peroxisomal biogenesis factor 11 [Durotheca rogersii]
MSTFEQAIRFTTDSAGMERSLRLVQAAVQILSSFALPFDLLLVALGAAAGPAPAAPAVRGVLAALNQRLGLARRYFRLFRFLEAFDGAQKALAQLTAPSSPADVAWLDVLARTFNGMYLLLEASTVVDALQVPGLALWGPERERRVTVEAQRFWLLALACGGLAALARIPAALALAAVPATPAGLAPLADAPTGEKDGEKEKEKETAESKEALRRRERPNVRAKVHKLGRTALASAIDIVLPGSVIGWISADPGTVAVAMFVTSILTGMDVWERCGREVAAGK